jgi:hypothetical protein
MPRHAATGTLRAPAAVADLSRVERDALMQQLQAQLKDAVDSQREKEKEAEQREKEADHPGTLPHFLTALATGFEKEADHPGTLPHFLTAFATGCTAFLAYVVTTTWRMRTRTTGRAEDPGTPPSVRAEGYVLNKGGRAMGSPLRMPEQWSDSDYSALSRAIWRESENTKQRVRTGPAAAVLSHAPAAYVVIFNKGTEDEGVYTLQSQVDPRKQHLLTFENSGDADRFANLLQGQGLDQLGKPLMWEAAKIVEYCEACEYAVTLVPVGTVFTPPQTNEMGADSMQMPAKQKRYDHALGLHMYKAERENLERLFGL